MIHIDYAAFKDARNLNKNFKTCWVNHEHINHPFNHEPRQIDQTIIGILKIDKKYVNQPINQPVNQPISQSDIQSVSQSINSLVTKINRNQLI